MVQRTKIPRSHEIKSLDFRPKRFDVRQASMMVHVGDVYTMSLSGDLCTIKKYMRALTREKNSVDETAHGRGYSFQQLFISLAIKYQTYDKSRRRHNRKMSMSLATTFPPPPLTGWDTSPLQGYPQYSVRLLIQ